MFGVGFPRRYAPVCQGGPMGIEAVEFRGGPADGGTPRLEADDFGPGVKISHAGSVYQLTGKAIGCAWRAVHVGTEVTGGHGWQ